MRFMTAPPVCGIAPASPRAVAVDRVYPAR
jgi:hypothetical protein